MITSEDEALHLWYFSFLFIGQKTKNSTKVMSEQTAFTNLTSFTVTDESILRDNSEQSVYFFSSVPLVPSWYIQTMYLSSNQLTWFLVQNSFKIIYFTYFKIGIKCS